MYLVNNAIAVMGITVAMVKMKNFASSKNKFGYVYLLTPKGISEKITLTGKFLERKQAEYEALKAFWGGFAGYDPWAAQANNALFAAQAAYDELVPAFEALFEREGRDFARFYDAVRALAALPKEERRSQLMRLAPTPSLVALHTGAHP